MLALKPMSRLLCLLITLTTQAMAQTLPNHAPPTRDMPPPEASMTAIRFLTTVNFPPFSFHDVNGQLIGFNIDVARYICAEINAACTIQAWPWAQAADALSSGRGDALIAGLAATPENGARFDFSATYLAMPGRFVARAGDASNFDQEKLAGKIISTRANSVHEAFLMRYTGRATVKGFANEIDALTALRNGEVDFFFGDALRASFWLNDNLACCEFVGAAYFRPHLFSEGMTIAVPAGQDAIRHTIDWALVRLKDNGALDELYLRWFPVGFY